MDQISQQANIWASDFGALYTERNMPGIEELDRNFQATFGIARTAMVEEFFGGLDRSLRILEVGCNVGHYLWILQDMGFENLYGIDVQTRALEKARSVRPGIHFVHGNALDIPFKDGYFDLVYTAGVLIHISPEHIRTAMDEITRCSSRYVWGFEYWNGAYTEINYRGNSNMLWKADFPRVYMENRPGLRVIKERKFPHLDGSGNADIAYLIEKKS